MREYRQKKQAHWQDMAKSNREYSPKSNYHKYKQKSSTETDFTKWYFRQLCRSLLASVCISPTSLTSKTRVPRAHQSTPFPWPLFSKISGARYSGVPQKVLVPPSAPAPVTPLFARPKSVRRRCPWASNLMRRYQIQISIPISHTDCLSDGTRKYAWQRFLLYGTNNHNLTPKY